MFPGICMDYGTMLTDSKDNWLTPHTQSDYKVHRLVMLCKIP